MKFPTVKSIRHLWACFSLQREYANPYFPAIAKADMRLWQIVGPDLRRWARAERKATGKKCVPTDFLRLRAADIRQALDGLSLAADPQNRAALSNLRALLDVPDFTAEVMAEVERIFAVEDFTSEVLAELEEIFA